VRYLWVRKILNPLHQDVQNRENLKPISSGNRIRRLRTWPRYAAFLHFFEGHKIAFWYLRCKNVPFFRLTNPR